MGEALAMRLEDDRFDRFRRISWWEQDRLHAAKVLVIGAGALGNEVLKNLALLGIGQVFIADLDRIDRSNLSRSILFREEDCGRPKAQVAAEAVVKIYPEMETQWFHGDVINELGLGVFEWADLVIGGLDNREARLWINRYCWKTNRPFIDGATEVLQGVVRVFVPPDGACYECTMSAADWEVLKERRGCDGMRPAGLPVAMIPTTPVTASIIAALQCQEAVKLLHGITGLAGHGFVFNGASNESYTFRINVKETCNSHEGLDQIIRLNRSTSDMSMIELLERAQSDLGAGTVVEFNQELLISFRCSRCDGVEPVLRPLGSVLETAAVCPACRQNREAVTAASISGAEPFLDRTFSELGIPRFDIVSGRKGLRRFGYQFFADGPAVMGRLWNFRTAATQEENLERPERRHRPD
ncbi:MAG TPA: ThiF family adenylyltransferase [Candidatus Angelobacter sp.]|nr:ThiF family adenylyltransferase [Candidatus Angelobacter sp.]